MHPERVETIASWLQAEAIAVGERIAQLTHELSDLAADRLLSNVSRPRSAARRNNVSAA